MNNLRISLVLFFIISGCTTVEFAIHDRTDSQKYGSWDYISDFDEFRGRYLLSMVKSEDGLGTIRVITFKNSNEHWFEIKNGDSYICIVDYSIPIKFKFIKGNQEEIIDDYFYGLTNRSGLMTTNAAEVHNYVQWLNHADKVIIRTTDDCGNTIDKSFLIQGKTHLRPVLSES